MNKSDLEAKLAAQRKWREAESRKSRRNKRGGALPIMIAASVAILGLLAFIFPASPAPIPKKETPEPTASPTHMPAVIKTANAPSPAPRVMKVCAENLHVRFAPEGDVRGYLREGETVTLAADEQGRSARERRGSEIWILIAAPIEGWANEKYLCK